MATTDSHGLERPEAATTDRLATDQLRETLETTLETLLKPTTFDVRRRCEPDGDWFQAEDGMTRKTWARRGGEDRVQLASAGPASTWRLEHQTADGCLEIVAAGLEREAAYTRAEEYMADLSEVEQYCRTGRAAEVDK